MAKKTPIDKLQSSIQKTLNEYGDDIEHNLGVITRQLGQRGVTALKAEAKQALSPDAQNGPYVRGWKYEFRETRRLKTTTIFNDHYSLPHLLEYGHVTRNGTGRTFARTPAHEHIKPVADEIIDSYEREVLAKL